VSIVALTYESGPDGVQQTRAESPRAFVEVTGILMKHGLRHHMTDQNLVDKIRVIGPEPLGIALRALPVLPVAIPCLLDSAGESTRQYGNRIEKCLPSELELLRGSQWGWIWFIGNKIVRKQTGQTLFLLVLQLLLIDADPVGGRGLMPPSWHGLHESKGRVAKLSALFTLDAFGGGFIVQYDANGALRWAQTIPVYTYGLAYGNGLLYVSLQSAVISSVTNASSISQAAIWVSWVSRA